MSDPQEPDDLSALLNDLDRDPLPTETAMDQTAPSPSGESGPPSRTLEQLEESRRPKPSTICETCPNSVWFASPVEVRCYCRVMFLVTWSSKEPNVLLLCDGIYLGQDQSE